MGIKDSLSAAQTLGQPFRNLAKTGHTAYASGIELLLCLLLGTSTFATWFCITILKYVQLMDFDAYKDFKAKPWGLSLSHSPRSLEVLRFTFAALT